MLYIAFVALAAAPTNMESLSTEARFDLDCFESGISMSQDPDSGPMAQTIANFYLGRLSTRYNPTNWYKVAGQDGSRHSTDWYSKNLDRCVEKMGQLL